MTTHKQTTVTVGNMKADIDEGIAPLIEQIWKADIYTVNSCEENRPDIIWIEFLTPDDASWFLNIVAQYDKDIDSLYNRARNGWLPCDDNDMPHPFWEYALHPCSTSRME